MEVLESYARLVPTAKSGGEPFHRGERPLDLTLLDFWRWSASDLVSNATRGILAEYIVANALGLSLSVRAEWDAFDLLLPSDEGHEGVKIEVKSASYLQTWLHKKLSPISFGIGATQIWDADTNEMVGERKRQSDVYVFCLLHHQHKATLDPLNLDQWTFFVLATSVLDAKIPLQKTISLSSLKKLEPCVVTYNDLGACVRELVRPDDEARTIVSAV